MRIHEKNYITIALAVTLPTPPNEDNKAFHSILLVVPVLLEGVFNEIYSWMRLSPQKKTQVQYK